ncbi:DUF6457 domain-containing protein [Corynebacterium dentalis]|uniref:DUF6457 domain-containing protein n=1 Tax=Corynebacterium dentalis TaxID=2014528 RepID=UPI0028A08F84|nr:DUF6457 domain-containing protein [Corynebacterium dentalis]
MSNSETNSSAQNKRKDSPEEAQKASEWLAVCRLLEIPEDVQRANVKGVLDLTSAVAHNKSRPAAPVTAFLVGLAAGAAAGREGGSSDLFSDAISSRLQLIAEAAGKDSGRPSE